MEKLNSVVSLANWRERKKMGVQKSGKKWEVAVATAERHPRSNRIIYARKGGFDTEVEAKNYENEIMQEQQRDNPKAEVAVVLKKLKFADIAAEWLERKRNEVRLKTFERHKEVLELHLIPYFGEYIMDDITKNDIKQYYQNKLDCRQSFNRHRTILNQIFDEAEIRGIVEINLSRAVKAPAAKKPPKLWIDNVEELCGFIQKFKTAASVLYIIAYIASRTGMRRSEILPLRWSSINYEYRYVLVTESMHYDRTLGHYTEQTKSSSSYRKITLSTETIRELKAVMAERGAKPDDFICLNSEGKLINPETLSSNFRKTARRYGYNISFKSLRASYATILKNAGVEDSAIQEDLGHADRTTMRKYYLITTKAQREFREQVKETLFTLNSGVSADTPDTPYEQKNSELLYQQQPTNIVLH